MAGIAGVFAVVVKVLMGVKCVIQSGAVRTEAVVIGCKVEDVGYPLVGRLMLVGVISGWRG